MCVVSLKLLMVKLLVFEEEYLDFLENMVALVVVAAWIFFHSLDLTYLTSLMGYWV